MKKIFSLNKVETIALVAGLVSIAVFGITGIAKNQFTPKKAYQSPKQNTAEKTTDKPEETPTSAETLELKKETFIYIIGETLDKTPSTYLSNDEDALNGVKMDFASVDVTLPGTYTAKATKKDQTKEFQVVVTNSKDPVFSASFAEIDFYLEADSTIQEVKEYVNVSAVDVYGNDITGNITGWETEVPATPQTSVYTLSVKDVEGNSASFNLTVHYMYPQQEG